MTGVRDGQGESTEVGKVRCYGIRLENGTIRWRFCERERGRQRLRIEIIDDSLWRYEEARLQISQHAFEICGISEGFEGESHHQEWKDSQASSHLCWYCWQHKCVNNFEGKEPPKLRKVILHQDAS